MSGIVNKVKEAVSGHSHKDDTTTHTTGTHGTHNTTAGPHASDMGNKMDPRVDSDRDGSRTIGGAGAGYGSSHTGTTGTTGLTGTTHHHHNTTAGPHSSDMGNKMDPRVDSDRDGSRTMGGAGHSSHSHGHGAGMTGSGVTHTSHTTAGPHSSDMANKLDPRVDSDLDGSRTVGGNQTHTGGMAGTYGAHTTRDTHGAYGATGGSATTGPHSSAMANKMDPRVDSDRDGSKTMGTTGGHGHGHTMGTTGYSHTSGPHSSDMANKADPRVDSDRDGSRTVGGAGAGYGSTHTGTTGGLTGSHHNTTGAGVHGGPGPAPNTAGPHKSDMMNKLDPRVDSDLDGSKTMGQDKTFSSNVDTHDASQVPPSQFQKPVGHHTATQGSRKGSV